MPFFTTLLSFNPDIEKYNYLMSINNPVECVSYSEELIDLKNTFYLYRNNINTKVDVIKEQLLLFVNNSDTDLKISNEVYNSADFIISNLYPSIYNELILDNIYSSQYGTLIFDWEKKNGDIFSLEIGSKTLGYFIEINGVDEKQVEEVDVELSLDLLLQDLSIFLNN